MSDSGMNYLNGLMDEWMELELRKAGAERKAQREAQLLSEALEMTSGISTQRPTVEHLVVAMRWCVSQNQTDWQDAPF
ncbi:hypothetical protein [Chromatium okenii]|jgi:hypothetical protein|uniref:hypothetical protein n=1 Tax=Chromatium okenii TaxID=61644 RepID=UPI0026F2DD95|nr:hypothetical protein [Chromatium okenii]MBV5308382.1 hypothetical protein [Chromatium okenii]